MASDAPRGAEDTLNGWKEIAAYLGKSARSVQRWERELHLPVHRINTPDGGQIISSTRSEIDQWKRALDAKGPGRDREASRMPLPSAQAGARWRQFVTGRAAFLALGVVLGAAAVALVRFTVPSRPDRFELDADRLTAYSSAGVPVWNFAFGRTAHHPPNARATMLGDVDGDGSTDVVVAVRFAAPLTKSQYSDAILAFRRDGSLIWQVQPVLQIAHKGQTFEGPWQVLDFEISPDRGRPRVSIAYNHQTWRPAFVLEVDPAGRSSLRYVQSGWLHALTYWQTPAGTMLAAAGVGSEYSRPSVALLNVDDEPAQSVPNGDSPLVCEGCPRGAPDAFFLFPPSELPALYSRPYSWAKHITQDGAFLKVATDEGFGAGSVATISPDFRVVAFERSDRFWEAHRALEDKGQIRHGVEACPDHIVPQGMRVWQPESGWAEYVVASVIPPPVQSGK